MGVPGVRRRTVVLGLCGAVVGGALGRGSPFTPPEPRAREPRASARLTGPIRVPAGYPPVEPVAGWRYLGTTLDDITHREDLVVLEFVRDGCFARIPMPLAVLLDPEWSIGNVAPILDGVWRRVAPDRAEGV